MYNPGTSLTCSDQPENPYITTGTDDTKYVVAQLLVYTGFGYMFCALLQYALPVTIS